MTASYTVADLDTGRYLATIRRGVVLVSQHTTRTREEAVKWATQKIRKYETQHANQASDDRMRACGYRAAMGPCGGTVWEKRGRS